MRANEHTKERQGVWNTVSLDLFVPFFFNDSGDWKM
jgi:hypothetical protein